MLFRPGVLLTLLLLLPGPANAADLVVSAAISLQGAFQALQPLFERTHPDIQLRYNFAASGTLLQQIVQGAPVAVFASADEETMDRAQASGQVLASTRRRFANNALVLITPSTATHPLSSLDDLSKPISKRIALGQPASVPAGRYAESALRAAGLWDAVQPKLIITQNVRQALDYVARGEVDAGFVYSTDALLAIDKVHVALRIPTALPVSYPIAPIVGSKQAVAAAQFVDFVMMPQAQAVLARYGFSPP